MLEPKCKNCLLYDKKKSYCRVAILIDGKQIHMPVFPEDHCHMDELGIEVEQVRWFKDEEKNVMKIEYPENFFGENQ